MGSPSGAVCWISLETVLETQQCFGCSYTASRQGFLWFSLCTPSTQAGVSRGFGRGHSQDSQTTQRAIACYIMSCPTKKKPGESSVSKVAAAQKLVGYQSAPRRWWGTDCLCITCCCPFPSLVKLPLSNNEFLSLSLFWFPSAGVRMSKQLGCA